MCAAVEEDVERVAMCAAVEEDVGVTALDNFTKYVLVNFTND